MPSIGQAPAAAEIARSPPGPVLAGSLARGARSRVTSSGGRRRAPRRDPRQAVRDRRAHRRGRDGGGVSRRAVEARSRGRDQGDARRRSRAIGDARKRFEREARLMARLEHPHCVSIVDFGVHEREAVRRDGARARARACSTCSPSSGASSPPRAVDIMCQVLSGLAHAHEQDIIHRDIKPANIMITPKAPLGVHARILDFGLARMLGSSIEHEQRASRSARRATWRPSSAAATSSMRASTSTRAASCCSRC